MLSLLIGIALASGASTLYSLGIAVQSLDARVSAREHALRISLLTHLATRARWLFVLLLVGERMLGESPGRRELLAVGAIVAGVAGIAVLAPGHSTHHVHGVAVFVVLTLLGAAAFTPFVLQLIGRPIANATMIGAGLAFAWSGLVNQFVADAGQNGHWGTALSWAAGAALAALVA